MIKRTVEISQQPVHLTVRDEQLLLLRKPDPPGEARTAQPDSAAEPRRGVRARLADSYASSDVLAAIPCEDVGVVLVEHSGTTYSHAALERLLRHDAAVIVCGRDHLPAGLLLPLGEHTQVVWRLRDQLAAPKPLRKQLWRQLIQAKIRGQAANLDGQPPARSHLLALAREVRSGDPSNIEAQAARVYWSVWLAPDEFRRDPAGPPPNNLLNYGYTVMRAAVARAVVAAGLLPALGIHHANRSNAFCLADDLVEPLRPIVDVRVRALSRDGFTELIPSVKSRLLELLTSEVWTGEQRGPLMVALHRYAASLVRCFEGAEKKLAIPVSASDSC